MAAFRLHWQNWLVVKGTIQPFSFIFTTWLFTRGKNSCQSLFKNIGTCFLRLSWWLSGKEFTRQCKRCKFSPLAGKIPWRRKRQLTPVFLTVKSCGQRSLADYSPWGHRESDMNEWLNNKRSSLKGKLEIMLLTSMHGAIKGHTCHGRT